MSMKYNDSLRESIENDESDMVVNDDDDRSVMCPKSNYLSKQKRMQSILHNKNLDDEKYHKAIFDEQKKHCGDLCNNNQNKQYHYKNEKNIVKYHIRTEINCCNLFSAPIFDEPAVRWPIDQIPKAMYNDYTLNGKSKIETYLFRDRVSGLNRTVSGDITKELTPKWERQSIDALIAKAKKGDFSFATYSAGHVVYEAARYSNFSGKHILVVGSQSPWVESTLFAAGVRKITTLEYMKIKTDHPQLTTMMPSEFNKKYMNGELNDAFDGAFTFSSVEHSGLGRYGDLPNPWGDVIAIAKVWCTIKDGGIIGIGVPDDGEEKIHYNAHRYYGEYRWPLLLTNWEAIHKIPFPAVDFSQPIVIGVKRTNPQ